MIRPVVNQDVGSAPRPETWVEASRPPSAVRPTALRALALLLLGCCWLITWPAMASDLSLEIAGQEVPVRVYGAEGRFLILWLPSEYGISDRDAPLAEALAAAGVEVWVPDLHTGLFLPEGPYSLTEVPREAVPVLIEEAAHRSGKTVYLMAGGRTVPLALLGARDWQLAGRRGGRLGGALVFRPKLYRRTPQGGEEGELLPIALASNLPIYLIQPVNSSGYWWLDRVVHALESGGSPVFVQRLAGVGDIFRWRKDPIPQERAMTARLPGMLRGAMDLMEDYGGAPERPAPISSETIRIQRPSRDTLLRPYSKATKAPPLALEGLGGTQVALGDFVGRVVLVSFWATWCPPCVKEIPSLNRLYTRLAPAGLRVLAINVGEPRAQVQAFLADKRTDFPVLLDRNGRALRDWRVYAFPTTFVIDATGRIRYAVYGAFAWDSPEVITTLQGLLSAAAPLAR